MDDQTTNDITMETIENKISNDELNNLVLNTIATIRKYYHYCQIAFES